MAERALELMCARAESRVAFGGPLAEQGVVKQQIAESKKEMQQTRLLTMAAAHKMDTQGNKVLLLGWLLLGWLLLEWAALVVAAAGMAAGE
jgi:alkylation response protein AidB-like acyl-CoA dehydrogenase